MRNGIILLLSALLFASCASLSRYPGVGRTKRYTFEHAQVPETFDGFRIAFISDTHLSKQIQTETFAQPRACPARPPSDLLLLAATITRDVNMWKNCSPNWLKRPRPTA